MGRTGWDSGVGNAVGFWARRGLVVAAAAFGWVLAGAPDAWGRAAADILAGMEAVGKVAV